MIPQTVPSLPASRPRAGPASRKLELAGQLGSIAAVVLAMSCVEATGPGSHAPSDLVVSLVLPAATPAIWFPTGESLHVTVRRAGRAEPIVDTSLVITASLRAEFPVPMSQARESFVATAEVLYSGSLYFLGFEALRIRAGVDTTITLDAVYVGPGARAASYALSLRDSTLRRGDTTSLVPLVLDSSGQRMENVPARYVSRRPTIVAVAPTGVLSVQPVPPDTARVAGYLPMGLRDSLVVRVRSRADSLAAVSGNNQTGTRLYPLGAALTVLVLGDDGNPVAGEPVQFAPDSGDGSFAPATVLTDAAGRAASVWTLGGRVGTQRATVSVEGVTPLGISATAQALPVDSVFVSPAAATLFALGRTVQLAATAYDSVGAVITGRTFAWSSANTGIVTVDSTGRATATGDGTTMLTATADGVSGSASVTVARVVAQVTVSPPAATLTVAGSTQQFTASAVDSAGADIAGKKFSWSALPPGIATVDSTGLATAVGDGVATIAASTGGVSDSAQLTVAIAITNATEEIVFISTRDGNREVYAMEADGSGARRITNTPEDEFFPAWASDRSAVVFERDVAGTRQVFWIGANGIGEQQLTSLGENTRPRFSPDGTRIGFTSTRGAGPEVWVMNADGGGQRRLVDPAGEVDAFADWSPDGRQILLVRRTAAGSSSTVVWTADTNGTLRRIVLAPGEGSAPNIVAARWGPLGGLIVYTHASEGTALMVLGLDQSGGPSVAHSGTFDGNAAFALADDRFVFESDTAGTHAIYAQDTAGGLTRLSAEGVGEFEPDYVPPIPAIYVDRVVISPDSVGMLSDGSGQTYTASVFDINNQPVASDPVFWIPPSDLGQVFNGPPIEFVGLAAGKTHMGASYRNWRTDSATITLTPATGPSTQRLVVSMNGYQIYTMSGDGTDTVRLTNGSLSGHEPAFSPDGSRIAWSSYVSGNADIYVMNADGSAPTPVTSGASEDRRPSWSPDGQFIVFASNRVLANPSQWQLWIIRSDGSGLRQLSFPPGANFQDADPAWSPDGSLVLFTRFVLGVGTSSLRVIPAQGGADAPLSMPAGSYRFPAWAPDGASIVYTRVSVGTYIQYLGIGRMPFPTGPETILSDGTTPRGIASGGHFYPSVASDGLITYQGSGQWVMRGDGTAQSGLNLGAGMGSWRLATPPRYVAAVTIGGDVATPINVAATRQLTSGATDQSGSPIVPAGGFRWSTLDSGVATVDTAGLVTGVAPGIARIVVSTGIAVPDTAQLMVASAFATEEIVFISTRDGNREVYAMEADGSGARRITNSADDEFFPAWAPDRSVIAFGREVAGDAQIFRVGADGSGEVQLTVDGVNTRPRFSPDGTKIGFTSTRNGSEEVWVMDADGGNQRRLIDPAGMADFFADWAPDGRQLVFIRRPDAGAQESEAYIADTAGLSLRKVYGDNDGDFPDLTAARWSPLGGEIVYTRITSFGTTVLASRTLEDLDGPLTDVADQSATFDGHAAFAAAGNVLVFESEAAGVQGVYWRDAVGTITRLSPADTAEYEPDHVPPTSRIYVDYLNVLPSPVALTSDQQRQVFTAQARDYYEAPVSVPLRRVQRNDGRTVALGEADLVAVAPGATAVVFTYGGWRTDSAIVSITPATGASARRLVFSANYQLFSLLGDGTDVLQLTNAAATQNDPTFSPDGSRIAWTSFENGNGDVYVMNANGSGQLRLTTSVGFDGYPSWSPDGQKLVFASDRAGGRWALWTMNADGSSPQQLTVPSGVDHVDPAWSPDGSLIVYASFSGGVTNLFAVRPTGGAPWSLGLAGRYPAWTPGGDTLLWSAGTPSRIRRRAFGGGSVADLTTGCGAEFCATASDFEPSVSPEGLILFWSFRNNASYGQQMIMRADGSAQSGLVPVGSQELDGFAFSGSGDWQPTAPSPYAATVVIGGDATTPLTPSATRQLSASAFDQTTQPITPVGGFRWTSLDAGVVTVDSTGLVTGVSGGTARIVLSSGVAVPDTVTLTVVPPFDAVSAGNSYSCGLAASGAPFCWGQNFDGSLGDSTTMERHVPTPVSGGLTLGGISAGWSHACGLTPAGAAYCWGSNGSGQLGDSTTTNSLVPVAVRGGLGFSGLAAGEQHTCGLTAAGAAFCWGGNGSGQLGDMTTTDRHTPVAVFGGLTFASLSSGGLHTCGVATDGQAYCWGSNTFGQLGDGTGAQSEEPVTVFGSLTFSSVSATGTSHSCGVTTSGVAYCWGWNGSGELGDGTTDASLVPVPVSGGQVFGSISAGGGGFTCGLTTAGAAFCWGLNDNGRLGDGTTTQRTAPVAVLGGLSFTALDAGFAHVTAIASGGAGYAWGLNSSGQLGDGSTTSSSVPVAVAPPNP